MAGMKLIFLAVTIAAPAAWVASTQAEESESFECQINADIVGYTLAGGESGCAVPPPPESGPWEKLAIGDRVRLDWVPDEAVEGAETLVLKETRTGRIVARGAPGFEFTAGERIIVAVDTSGDGVVVMQDVRITWYKTGS